MKRRTVFPKELIGEKIEIIDSKNKSCLGIQGTIVDETKNTVKVRLPTKRICSLLKNVIVFRLCRTGQVVVGQDITRRPEERIKG